MGQRGGSSVTEIRKHTSDKKKTAATVKTKKHTPLFLFVVFFCLLVGVMLSSGAELSHCEQRGNQSLFTNQLSSVPGWREDTKPVWETDVYRHTCTHTHIFPYKQPH